MPQRMKLAIHEITKQIEAYRLPSSHYLGRGQTEAGSMYGCRILKELVEFQDYSNDDGV